MKYSALTCSVLLIANLGLRHLSSMKNLEVLNLDSRDIGDEGCKYIRGLPLRRLDPTLGMFDWSAFTVISLLGFYIHIINTQKHSLFNTGAAICQKSKPLPRWNYVVEALEILAVPTLPQYRTWQAWISLKMKASRIVVLHLLLHWQTSRPWIWATHVSTPMHSSFLEDCWNCKAWLCMGAMILMAVQGWPPWKVTFHRWDAFGWTMPQMKMEWLLLIWNLRKRRRLKMMTNIMRK